MKLVINNKNRKLRDNVKKLEIPPISNYGQKSPMSGWRNIDELEDLIVTLSYRLDEEIV